MRDGKAKSDILDLYSKIRLEKFDELVDPLSTSNFERIFLSDPATVLEEDAFLQMCKIAEQDDEFSKNFQKVSLHPLMPLLHAS